MLTVTVQSQEVKDMLAQLSARLTDMTPAMHGIGQELQNRVSSRFETETDPLGNRWAQWAQSTVDSYPHDGNERILDRFGGMLESLNHQATEKATMVGFGDPVAAYHEWGTKHMPRRGLLMADPDRGTLAPADEAAVLAILSKFLSV